MQKKKFNPGKEVYNLDNLPIRTEEHYWNTIEALEKASTSKDRADIVRSTGISRLPLCATSLAFMH